MFDWFRRLVNKNPQKPTIAASYQGNTLTLIRKIKSKNGYRNSDLYLNGEKVAEVLNDTFPNGEYNQTSYDILYEDDTYPLLPDLILNHSNYEDLRAALINKHIKSVQIEVLERWLISI